MGNSESDPLDSWTPNLGIQIFTTIYLQPEITTQGTADITFRPAWNTEQLEPSTDKFLGEGKHSNTILLFQL